MKFTKFLANLAGAATLAITAATGALAGDTDSKAFMVLDILPLKEGATLEQAYAYFKGVEPIFAKYDFQRSDSALEVGAVVRGDVTANVVNLWVTDNPDAAFKGIFSDETYLAEWVPDRDAIFDLEKATIIVTQRGQTITTPNGKINHP
ncbi:hypothetical protein [Actibacterium mucosum]|nr:hypothetical protein [Actibacterium mucosum]